MRRRVAITGVGVACGGARDFESFGTMLFSGRGCLRPVPELSEVHGLVPFVAGVDDELAAPLDDAGARFAALSDLAADGLMADAGLDRETLSAMGGSCRLFLGTLGHRQGAIRRDAVERLAGRQGEAMARANDGIARLAARLGVRGAATVASAACASGGTAAMLAMEAVRSGLCETAVLAGVDGLSSENISFFQVMQAMSPGEARPFDAARDGMNVGEGAAMLLLEPMERAQERGVKIYGELLGGAVGNEAFNPAAPRPDGEGARRTMEAALRDAGVEAKEIGYIDAHGTGTAANDAAEMKAIEAVFGNTGREVAVASTKAIVGHTMGAAGVLELVSALAALTERKYVPLPRLENSIATADNLRLSATSFSHESDCALSNSLAFGGNTAALVVRV